MIEGFQVGPFSVHELARLIAEKSFKRNLCLDAIYVKLENGRTNSRSFKFGCANSTPFYQNK
jgi:hypothetical protein